MTSHPTHRGVLGAARVLALLGSLTFLQPAQAVEFGVSAYFLGLGFPFAGYTPPPGVYFRDAFYLYRGSFQAFGGRTTYNFLADVGIVAWYPEWEIFGASPGFAAVIPYLGVRNKLQTPTNGPAGATMTANSIADTYYSTILGWHNGEHHWNVLVTAFMPTGHYTPHELSITGLNRPAIDFRGAYTYFGLQSGIELSGALGFTVNATNTATNYRSGAEMHFEWALQQHFPFGLYVGAVGFVYQQLTGDSGAGAVNGSYIGRSVAVGPSVGYTIKAGPQELKLSGRWYHEFWVKNRPSGDSIFASLDFRF